MFVAALREMLVALVDGWAVILVGRYEGLGALCSSKWRDILHVVIFGAI